MAEVVITTRVNNELVEKSINNFKDLKKEIRASKDELLKYAEGSEDFKRVQQNVSKLQTSLKDLGDTARIQGSGVERLQQSFSLLTDSFTSGDIEKGKIALTGLGQAMSAIPIFLLISGFTLLIQNFEDIIKFVPGLKLLSDGFTALKNTVKDFTDAMGLTNFALQKTLDDNIKKTKEYSTELTDFYDNEIALLKASGQETFSLEQQKREEYRRTLQEQTAAIAQKVIANGKATDEENKQLKELDREYKKSLAETEIAEAQYATNKRERDAQLAKEAQDAADKKREKEERDLLIKQEKENALYDEAITKLYAQQDKEVEAELAKRERIEQIQRDQDDKEFKARIDATKKRLELDKQEAEESKRIKQTEFNNKIQITQIGLTAGQNLSKAYFQGQLNQVKGNAKEELEIRKKQFEVEKAFNLARAVIDGIRAVQATLAVPPLAVANGILAAANVALIASTTFDAGSSGASISSMPSATLASQPEAITSPAIPQFGESGSTQLNGGNGTINQTNTPITVRAIVVESDITNTQNTVNKERRTATFG